MMVSVKIAYLGKILSFFCMLIFSSSNSSTVPSPMHELTIYTGPIWHLASVVPWFQTRIVLISTDRIASGVIPG